MGTCMVNSCDQAFGANNYIKQFVLILVCCVLHD
jgi:hypothetical protein